MVLESKAACIRMEQNREPRNKSIHLQSLDLSQRWQKHALEKKILSSKNESRKTEFPHAEK
jgi:hypothetical protein